MKEQAAGSGILSHSDFRRVHNFSAECIISTTANGNIIYANPQAVKDFEFNEIDYYAQPVGRFVKQLSGEPLTLEHLQGGPSYTDHDCILLTASGRERRALISSAIYNDGQEYNIYLFIKGANILQKKEELFSYLNTAAEELARARDTSTALKKISALIVPKFANWFTIEVLKDGELNELVLAHDDPDMIKWARAYRHAYPTDLNSDQGAARVIKTGVPSFVQQITPEMVAASIHNPEQLEAVKKLDLQSVITVAMFNKKVVTGVISFVSTTAGHFYQEADLGFAQNFANHIALALENTRLNEAALAEIAQRRRIEEQLKITRSQLQSALSSGLVGTWMRDLETNRLYADESLSAMFGIPYSPDGHEPELFQQLIHFDDQEKALQQRSRAINENRVYEAEYKVNGPQGLRWFFARGKTDYNEQGSPHLFTGVIMDITRRKNAEIALKESEERYSAAFKNASVGILLADHEGNLVNANSAFTRITGYTEKDLAGKDFKTITHPDDLQKNIALYNRLFAGEIPDFVLEKRYFHKDGRIIWVRNSTSLVRNSMELPGYTISITEDITEQKRIQNELRESEELFHFLVDAIPHKIWTSGPDGRATYYNQGWYDYTGVTDFEELRATIWDILHPDDREEAATRWPAAILSGEETQIEHRFRRHDGEYRWHLSRFSAHKDEEGRIRLWVGTSTDIHEHKAIQTALAISESHFKALTQLNSLPIWQVNAQCQTVFVNDTWRNFTGVTSATINEEDWAGNIHPEDREATVQEFNQLFSQRQPIGLKYRFKHAPTGEYRWMLDNAQPVFNPAFYGYIGTMTDIHEQEQARIAIQLMMGKKDEFISIASHELKTPLTTVKAYFQLVQREMSQHNKLLLFADKATKQLNRLERLIGDLLDVSKVNAGKMSYNLEWFNFREILLESIESVQESTKTHQIIINHSCDVSFYGDRHRIEQVIINLLNNAVKYSPDANRVIINCETQGRQLIVQIQDFGIGIAPEHLNNLFERFYRAAHTSNRFQGLGLGLFISSEIVKRHGGSFRVESEPGRGTTFSFVLPIAN